MDEIESLLSNKELQSNPFINNLYNQLAYEYLRNGYYDKSEEFFEKSLEINNTDRFALYYLSTLYRESGKFDQSIELSEKHIISFPEDKEGYINKSISLLSSPCFSLKPYAQTDSFVKLRSLPSELTSFTIGSRISASGKRV